MKSAVLLVAFISLMALSSATSSEVEVSHTNVAAYTVTDWFMNVGLWIVYNFTLPVYWIIGLYYTLFMS